MEPSTLTGATLIGPLANGAAMLILAWVVYHVFGTLLPSMQRERREERSEERKDFLQSLQKIEARAEQGHLDAREAFMREIGVLRQSLDRHSLQISGLSRSLLHLASNQRGHEHVQSDESNIIEDDSSAGTDARSGGRAGQG